jgi:hypothetical protein
MAGPSFGTSQPWACGMARFRLDPARQNALAEKLIGSIRRHCLDQVVIFGEQRVRHLLNSYHEYYNKDPWHVSWKKEASIPCDPEGRTRARPANLGWASTSVRSSLNIRLEQLRQKKSVTLRPAAKARTNSAARTNLLSMWTDWPRDDQSCCAIGREPQPDRTAQANNQPDRPVRIRLRSERTPAQGANKDRYEKLHTEHSRIAPPQS